MEAARQGDSVRRHVPRIGLCHYYSFGPELRAEWVDERLNLELTGFDDWKRGCELWKQPGWLSKRIAVVAASRAGTARAQTPPANTRTMAIS